MKKINLVIALGTLSLCAAALTGCYVAVAPSIPAAPAATPSAVAASEGAATEETAPTGKTIEPLPSALDMKALDDCSFAAGFSSSGVTAEGITLTVYDCDKFDLVDISQLAPGDTIVVEGEAVTVTTVERNDIGILLNGGIEAGGFDLTTREDGVYIPTGWDGHPVFHALGEVTLPLDEAFVFTDRSDLEGPEVTCNAEAFLALENGSENEYMPQATTVTVAGGKIAAVTLDYMP